MMSALTYEALKKQVMATAVPVSSAYRGRRRAVTTKPTGMSGARMPNWVIVRVISSPAFRGRSPNGSDRLPWNCSARTM